MLEETVDGVDTWLIAVVADAWVSESSIKVMDEGIALSEEDRVFIQEFAWSFDLNNNEQRALFLQDIFDLFPEATLDDVKRVLPDFPDDAVHANTKRSGEWMWALMNYNNEVKNKWRQRLKEFIDENADPAKRATMKVLCLPWVECLEIPLYLELWFRPENIVWVEAWIVQWRKDQALIARFQANAAGYWIQTRIWKIEKVLETEETVFDVVSLDFLGPISPVTKEIIWVIKYSKRVILLTNFLWKREGEEMKESLRASWLISTANLWIISDLWDCPLSDYRLKRDSLQLAEAREAWTLASIVLEYSLIGYKGPFDEKLKGIFKNLREFTIRETWEDIWYEKLRTLVIFEITSMIGRYQQKFSEHLASLWENGRWFFDWLNAYLIKFILNLLLGMRPGPSKSFKYKSKSTWWWTSPMFCDFQVFERLSQSDFEQDKKLWRAVFSLLETVVSKLTLNIVPRVLPCTNSKRTFPVLDWFNGYVMTEWTNIVVQIDFSDVHEYILRNKDKLLEAENHEREEII